LCFIFIFINALMCTTAVILKCPHCGTNKVISNHIIKDKQPDRIMVKEFMTSPSLSPEPTGWIADIRGF